MKRTTLGRIAKAVALPTPHDVRNTELVRLRFTLHPCSARRSFWQRGQTTNRTIQDSPAHSVVVVKTGLLVGHSCLPKVLGRLKKESWS